MGCCNTTVTNIIRGVFPSEDPPEDLYHYYVELTMSGEFVDIINAPGYLSAEGVGQFDFAYFADLLRNGVTPNAGAHLSQTDSTYLIWFVLPQSTPPSDWTWNDNPITFSEGGIAENLCYEVVINAVSPLDDVLIRVSTLAGVANPQGLIPSYEDTGFNDALQDFYVTPLCGDGATCTTDISSGTPVIQILNTYLPQVEAASDDGVSQYPSNFNPIVCP